MCCKFEGHVSLPRSLNRGLLRCRHGQMPTFIVKNTDLNCVVPMPACETFPTSSCASNYLPLFWVSREKNEDSMVKTNRFEV